MARLIFKLNKIHQSSSHKEHKENSQNAFGGIVSLTSLQAIMQTSPSLSTSFQINKNTEYTRPIHTSPPQETPKIKSFKQRLSRSHPQILIDSIMLRRPQTQVTRTSSHMEVVCTSCPNWLIAGTKGFKQKHN